MTAIGGYFLQISDLEEALEIAKECPALKYGVTVEVTPCCNIPIFSWFLLWE